MLVSQPEAAAVSIHDSFPPPMAWPAPLQLPLCLAFFRLRCCCRYADGLGTPLGHSSKGGKDFARQGTFASLFISIGWRSWWRRRWWRPRRCARPRLAASRTVEARGDFPPVAALTTLHVRATAGVANALAELILQVLPALAALEDALIWFSDCSHSPSKSLWFLK